MIQHEVGQNLLEGAPEDYRIPLERPSLAEARAWCRQLTTSHYENFHVATFFLPKKVRPYFESIYAYCRVSDDLGDEVADPATALRLLNTWELMLDECYDAPEDSIHPVFVALRETITQCDLPRELFSDLLLAFKMDQVKTEYATWGELMEYSHYSATPVGRLVLWVCERVGFRLESYRYALANLVVEMPSREAMSLVSAGLQASFPRSNHDQPATAVASTPAATSNGRRMINLTR